MEKIFIMRRTSFGGGGVVLFCFVFYSKQYRCFAGEIFKSLKQLLLPPSS